MHIEQVNKFKTISHLIFISVSIALTVLLFEQLAIGLLGKIIFVAMGIGLELVKVYLFLFVKFHFNHKRIGFIIGTLYLIVYLSLAGISAIASLGFVLNEIQEQSFSASVSNIDTDSLVRDIESIEREIETKVRQQSELPYDYITASERLSEQIQKLREQRTEAVEKLQAAQNTRQTVTNDTFSLIGQLEWVDRTGEEVLFFILMSLVVLLEVVIALTSGHIYDRIPGKIQISKGEDHELGSVQKRESRGVSEQFKGKTGIHIHH